MKKVKIKISGSGPGDVKVELDGGESLGLVQTLQISCSVAGVNQADLVTILDDADIEILQRDTELKIIDGRKIKVAIEFLEKITLLDHEPVARAIAKTALELINKVKE